MLFEISSNKLINLIDNLPIQNLSFLKLFHLGQELFGRITLTFTCLSMGKPTSDSSFNQMMRL